MSFESFLSDLIATVVGGIALTLLFFFAKEKLFPPPHLTGRWYLEQLTSNTAYSPYAGMILRYVVMLWREGNRVEGTAEKIYEKSTNGERAFVGTNRTRATISGYVEKRYFGQDKIYLHVVEDGHGRESTHYYDLTMTDVNKMSGTFESMVADQEGTTKWQRKSF
ncbi:MAG: hypothetical protein ACO1PN_15665 [Betaproteobacteria bacterium]